jgi:thiol-disulfide isomerase/thioredoxin
MTQITKQPRKIAPMHALRTQVLLAFLVALALMVHAFPVRADDPPPFAGKVGPYVLVEPEKPVPLQGVLGPDGKPLDIAALKGKVLLINFWATWCGPCVVEMPTLDKLQGALGGDKFQVVPIALDRHGIKTVRPFWQEHGYKNLRFALDRKWKSARKLGVDSLPQSFIVDRRGMVVGYLVGPADWDSDKAKALIRHYIDKKD